MITELQNYQLQLTSSDNNQVVTIGTPCLTSYPTDVSGSGTVQVTVLDHADFNIP